MQKYRFLLGLLVMVVLVSGGCNAAHYYDSADAGEKDTLERQKVDPLRSDIATVVRRGHDNQLRFVGSKVETATTKLEAVGAFSIVLECVPAALAGEITKAAHVPTIGIGAGSGCDGQVLVIQDLLGLTVDFRPKFVRQFGRLSESVDLALREFDQAIKDHSFPNASESFTSDPSV